MKSSKGKTIAVSVKSRGTTGSASKEKIFASAKKLFADKGFRNVSVREIASDAGVNSALVGYHFGGKQKLFDEVYRSYAEPLAKERMNALLALTNKNKTPSTEEILKAWLLPWLKVKDKANQNSLYVHFTAHVSAERWKQKRKANSFSLRTHAAFIKAFEQCLPHLSRDTLTWRLHFIVGAIAFGLQDPNSLKAFSNGRCDSADLKTTFAQILAFALEGLSGPEPKEN
ncbi:MAG: TetR family transcriptional regulator [Acidobacteriota bacterium]